MKQFALALALLLAPTFVAADNDVSFLNGETLAVVECEPEYINTPAFAFEDVLQGEYILFW